jgi:hypothetical protein
VTKILVHLFLPFLFGADPGVTMADVNVFHYRCSDFVVPEEEACLDKCSSHGVLNQ